MHHALHNAFLLHTAGVAPEPPRSPRRSIYDIHGRLVHAGNIVPGDDAFDNEHEVGDPMNEKGETYETGDAPPLFLTADYTE